MTEVVKDEAKAEEKLEVPIPLVEEKREVELFPELEEEIDPEKKQRQEDINKILIQLTKENETAILLEDFPTALHALDQNPTEEEMEDYVATYGKYDKDGKGVIEYAAIHEIVEKRLKDPDTEEALLGAFNKLLDKDGKLSNQQFIYFMTTKGNPVEAEIVDSYIQYADQDKDGYVEVENFVKLLMSAKKCHCYHMSI
eukprot:TRINITY_DN14557_c0_g1_i2.p1 TRINITY_DN14557_c0_g1~~TRINITY_DN14557_c0_g1_i2.p1  ORF type:complete len:198 (+),score=87.15 TRINITY_DN14557_c0_g1_i2:80-673(+)